MIRSMILILINRVAVYAGDSELRSLQNYDPTLVPLTHKQLIKISRTAKYI